MNNINPVYAFYIVSLFIIGLYLFLDKFNMSVFHPAIITVIIIVAVCLIAYIKITHMDSEMASTLLYYIVMITSVAVILWKNKHDE